MKKKYWGSRSEDDPFLVYLDLSKAFDTSNRPKLLKKPNIVAWETPLYIGLKATFLTVPNT